MASDPIPYALGDYFDVVRRRWIYVATILPGAVLIAVYIAFTLPPLYRSSGTILLEPSSIPEDMVRTTVTTYASEQLELVWRRIFTVENLSSFMEDFDPYPDLPDLGVRAKAQLIAENTTTQRVDPITLEPLESSNAFSVDYVNPDPDIAAAVTGRLVEMFLDFSRQTRTERATDTLAFLEVQSEDASSRVLELEEEIALFKEEHGFALPEGQQRNLNVLDRAERELEAAEREIVTARARRTMLELQLSQLNPRLFDPDGDWRAELAELRSEFAIARQRYTEDHPDVRRLRRSIESLSARAELEQPSDFTVPDNPQYIQAQNQLDTVEQELASLEGTARTTREQILEYERRLQVAPEVEREYVQLARDYDLARDRLRGIENDLTDAAMARILESEQRGLRYTLIRPPGVPSSPSSPNRLGIIMLGLVLGGGLAAGLAALRESSDPSIRGTRDLAAITEIHPLGAVPIMLNQADRRRRLLTWATGSLVFAAAVLLVGSRVTG